MKTIHLLRLVNKPGYPLNCYSQKEFRIFLINVMRLDSMKWIPEKVSQYAVNNFRSDFIQIKYELENRV